MLRLDFAHAAALSIVLAFATSAEARPVPPGPNLSTHPVRRGVAIESDSGFEGPKLEDLHARLNAHAARAPQLARTVVVGQTIQGRPLLLLRIAKEAGIRGGRARRPSPLRLRSELSRPAVLFSGATHGNEYLGVEDKLVDWIMTQAESPSENSVTAFLDRGGIVYALPVFNADGYVADERGNARGVDLNRDFSIRAGGHVGFRQPESQQLAEFLAKDFADANAKLVFSLDYHCCQGSLLHPWSFRGPRLDPVARAAHEKVGLLLQSIFGRSYIFGTAPDLLGYSALGTTKDYYFETYDSLAFTFEGVYKKENERFDYHRQFWDRVFTDAAQGGGIFRALNAR